MKPNLEVLMLRFVQFANNCFGKNETTIQNLQASVQNLETQIGQIDKALLERLLGTSHHLTLFLGRIILLANHIVTLRELTHLLNFFEGNSFPMLREIALSVSRGLTPVLLRRLPRGCSAKDLAI